MGKTESSRKRLKEMTMEMYVDGEYLRRNPTWDVEHSPWKARQIVKMMGRNDIVPKIICEVGCGAGAILSELQKQMGTNCSFWGYEISPQAFELSRQKSNENLNFRLKDILEEANVFFDLILMIDLIEHLEDYFGFLRKIKPKSQYKILHIPLDLSVQTVFRMSPILRDRESEGHINYFTKDLALRTLSDVGYDIVDYFYTGAAIDLPVKSINRQILKLPRKLLFGMHPDLAVRILGGYSLMLLVK